MFSGVYGSLAVLSHAECISSTDKDTWKDLKHQPCTQMSFLLFFKVFFVNHKTSLSP